MVESNFGIFHYDNEMPALILTRQTGTFSTMRNGPGSIEFTFVSSLAQKMEDI